MMADTPHQRTPSNTSKKRLPPSTNKSTVTPGHVAQVQRLFQSAKASLRFDMAFAASPVGSIGSRFTPDKVTPVHSPADVAQGAGTTPVKDWRYSLAPNIVAASEVDVREPVPEGSPTLPDISYLEDENITEPAVEPLSSGFNSPMETAAAEANIEAIKDLDADNGEDDDFHDAMLPPGCENDLARTMTKLKVCSDDENADMDLDESPIVSHLNRVSGDIPSSAQQSESDEKEIFLSEPAEAAAEFAKAKRGLLRRLFSPKSHHSSPVSESHSASSGKTSSKDSPCPDPSLHKLISMGACPDPAAHLRRTPPNILTGPMISITPEAALTLAQHTPSPVEGTLHPPAPPFHRASSTGSPMPFVRPHTAISSPGPMYDSRRQAYYGPPLPPYGRGQPLPRPQTRNGYPGLANEHFQPGWYYAREPAQPTERLSPMTYSFSTAAAKVIGQSSAPDSRIRDSYRTDTLTPLAKPPSRFRKTGIGALATGRGVSKYYDGPGRTSSRETRSGTGRSKRGNIQFRSSPPRAPENMASAHQKRPRPRELEDEQFEIHEDGIAPHSASGQAASLGDGEEPIEVDENTRAAVRMSLYGPDTPEALQGAREGIKELSPNVNPWRKGMRQPRKKRRPSYWDGDLKQVRESPAGRQEQVRSLQPGAERHVMTSPAKEDVESMRVSVREENVEVDVENLEVEAEAESPAEVEEMVLEEDDDEMEVEVEPLPALA